MEDEVVASHVRSLQMDHITDVASSNEHTVKPWFHGKLDYAPPVEDYTAQGFPLIGGRLEYLDHQNVAALVYRRAQHPINVFILPRDAADSAPQFRADHGYNMWRWTKGGMAFWAVSDVNDSDLAKLVELLREQKRDGPPDQ
jgi:anti-sigma factor RsiW